MCKSFVCDIMNLTMRFNANLNLNFNLTNLKIDVKKKIEFKSKTIKDSLIIIIRNECGIIPNHFDS